MKTQEVKIQFYGSEVIGVTVPTTVELTVAETQPSIKGATVTGSGKPATMETGLVVNVPDFIEAGQNWSLTLLKELTFLVHKRHLRVSNRKELLWQLNNLVTSLLHHVY